MNRRDLVQSALLASAAALLPRSAFAQMDFAPQPGAWRTFQVTTRLDLAAAEAQAWVPLPSVNESEWFRSLDNTWATNAATAEIVADPRYGASALHLVWPDGTAAPAVEVTSRIQTRDRATDFDRQGSVAPLSDADRRLYLQSTELIPTTGIVKETADAITAGLGADLDRARAIYDWVVENTFRDAAARGCGLGDVASMLDSGFLGGKCADINALFVGLARASGLPARDVYGLRVAPSRFGYASLGAKSEVVTKSQHCRAEVHLAGYGWVPVDPADVRKVALEEPPGDRSLDDAKVVAARATLFGASEGNWLAYNFAHDVALPGSHGPELAFLMYPQAELLGARLDCLDPDSFRYAIRSVEVLA